MKNVMYSLGAALLVSAASAFAGVATGDAAPAFSGVDPDGQTHKLSDYEGKFVVLEWVNFGCPFVKKHYGSDNMQNLQKKYTGEGVVWLTVCSSAKGKGGYLDAEAWKKAYADKKMASSAVLIDADGSIGKAYGAKATPHMSVIGPKGTLIYQGAIDSIPSPRASDIEKAENYVASALDAAMAGKPVKTGTTRAYGCGVKY